MTVRLLRQFLQAGIRPEPALQTLNAAAMLRCQSGAGFTTIDLVRLEKGAATLTLYKYGAAPSYLKRRGTVVRCQGSSLPAGLESAGRQNFLPAARATAPCRCWPWTGGRTPGPCERRKRQKILPAAPYTLPRPRRYYACNNKPGGW